MIEERSRRGCDQIAKTIWLPTETLNAFGVEYYNANFVVLVVVVEGEQRCMSSKHAWVRNRAKSDSTWDRLKDKFAADKSMLSDIIFNKQGASEADKANRGTRLNPHWVPW
jgi:hypothetical protein